MKHDKWIAMSHDERKTYISDVFKPMMELNKEINEHKEELVRLERRRQLYNVEVIFFGKRQQPEIELEIFMEDEYGYRAVIEFNNNSPYKGDKEIMNNLTEVHYLYSSIIPSIAFESDIHGGGRTAEIKNLKRVTIIRNTEVHDQLYEE